MTTTAGAGDADDAEDEPASQYSDAPPEPDAQAARLAKEPHGLFDDLESLAGRVSQLVLEALRLLRATGDP